MDGKEAEDEERKSWTGNVSEMTKMSMAQCSVKALDKSEWRTMVSNLYAETELRLILIKDNNNILYRVKTTHYQGLTNQAYQNNLNTNKYTFIIIISFCLSLLSLCLDILWTLLNVYLSFSTIKILALSHHSMTIRSKGKKTYVSLFACKTL